MSFHESYDVIPPTKGLEEVICDLEKKAEELEERIRKLEEEVAWLTPPS